MHLRYVSYVFYFTILKKPSNSLNRKQRRWSNKEFGGDKTNRVLEE